MFVMAEWNDYWHETCYNVYTSPSYCTLLRSSHVSLPSPPLPAPPLATLSPSACDSYSLTSLHPTSSLTRSYLRLLVRAATVPAGASFSFLVRTLGFLIPVGFSFSPPDADTVRRVERVGLDLGSGSGFGSGSGSALRVRVERVGLDTSGVLARVRADGFSVSSVDFARVEREVGFETGSGEGARGCSASPRTWRERVRRTTF